MGNQCEVCNKPIGSNQYQYSFDGIVWFCSECLKEYQQEHGKKEKYFRLKLDRKFGNKNMEVYKILNKTSKDKVEKLLKKQKISYRIKYHKGLKKYIIYK